MNTPNLLCPNNNNACFCIIVVIPSTAVLVCKTVVGRRVTGSRMTSRRVLTFISNITAYLLGIVPNLFDTLISFYK